MDYEKKIDIPFGTFDSELLHQEINIPDGFEATIEGNKVILKRKESEDEKIRKEIIEYIKTGTYHKSWLAWLEKQGKQKHKIQPKFKIGDIIRFKGNETLKGEAETHKIVSYDNELYVFADGTTDLFCEQDMYELVEQNPTDKVKPKFHKGEWVVWNNQYYKVNYNSCGYELIDQNGLHTSLEYGTVDKDAHLWSIKDARNGDVVVDKSDGAIGIFQSIGHHPDGGSYNDTSYCFLHCRYDDGFFYADFEHGNTIDSADIIPATKEQRDILMKAMTDAGYTFDFEKKELKKIENKNPLLSDFFKAEYERGKADAQKPVEWSEEDEKKRNLLIDILNVNHPNGYFKVNPANTLNMEAIHTEELVDWLKSLRPQSKQEWSKEDENNILFLTSIIEECFKDKEKITLYGDTVCANFTKEDVIDRLKSLRPQKQWKPSEEQMKLLKELVEDNSQRYFYTILKSLYEQLKKLREE